MMSIKLFGILLLCAAVTIDAQEVFGNFQTIDVDDLPSSREIRDLLNDIFITPNTRVQMADALDQLPNILSGAIVDMIPVRIVARNPRVTKPSFRRLVDAALKSIRDSIVSVSVAEPEVVKPPQRPPTPKPKPKPVVKPKPKTPAKPRNGPKRNGNGNGNGNGMKNGRNGNGNGNGMKNGRNGSWKGRNGKNGRNGRNERRWKDDEDREDRRERRREGRRDGRRDGRREERRDRRRMPDRFQDVPRRVGGPIIGGGVAPIIGGGLGLGGLGGLGGIGGGLLF